MSCEDSEDKPKELPQDSEATFHPRARMGVTGVVDSASEVDTEAPTVAPVVLVDDQASAPAEKPGYILKQTIGQGGFAEVWEALQVSLGRVVAVKRLKTATTKGGKAVRLPSTHAEAMFRHEAVIAAHLEHPNILPIYDLGTDDEGHPLMVMKRVRGQLWSDVLREDFAQLNEEDFLAKHLPVLVSVAQAVAYAHSQGVVHRDLKPAQVMIGLFGETLLMDWGLAMAYPRRVQDPDAPHWLRDPRSPLNHPVNPAGTPAYMAPEQTIPTPEKLGPWTDIYLLGGILYRLLTGTAPHPGKDADETFEYARRGFVVPPREAAPPGRRLPSGLAELAMRCLAYDPADRPSTVTEFIASIHECMTGAKNRGQALALVKRVEETLATAPRDYATLANCVNSLDRALQLYPENQQAVELRTKVLATYARQALANRDLKLARLQAERLPDGEERETLLAHVFELEEMQRRQQDELDRANYLVREERDRAEQLVEFLLGHFYRSLRSVGRLDLLRQLGDELNTYFANVHSEVETEQTRRNRMEAYRTVAEILTDQGNCAQALGVCQKAVALALRALDLHPNQPYWMARLADVYDHMAMVSYYQGRYDIARAHSEHALELRRRIMYLCSGDDVEASFACSLHKRGIIEWRCGNYDKALELHIEAETLLRRLFMQYPKNEEYQSALAWVLATLGNVYRDRGEIATAIEVTREALSLRERLMQRAPRDVTRRDDVIWTRNNLALMYLVANQHEEALSLLQANLSVLRRRAQEDTSKLTTLGDLTFALSLCAEILFMKGKVPDAEQLIHEALIVTQAMEKQGGASVYVKITRARVECQLAEVAATYGAWRQVQHHLELARARAEEAFSLAPTHPMAAKVLCKTRLLEAYLAHREQDSARVDYACQEARKAAEVFHQPSEETDYLEAQAQWLLLEHRYTEAEEAIRALQERRWFSPYLARLAQECSRPPFGAEA